MATIFLYDERATVSAVKADLVMCVGQNDNITLKIQELAKLVQSKFISISPGWAHELRIRCNGDNKGLDLGSGVDCQNIDKVFSYLKFKVGNIIIEGCNATFVYQRGNNGIVMCKKLAQTVYANVTASNSSNGNTVTWNQSGNLNSLQEFDNAGVLLHSIQRPGAHALSQFKRSCKQASPYKNSNLSLKHLLITCIRKFNHLFVYFPAHTTQVARVVVTP